MRTVVSMIRGASMGHASSGELILWFSHQSHNCFCAGVSLTRFRLYRGKASYLGVLAR